MTTAEPTLRQLQDQGSLRKRNASQSATAETTMAMTTESVTRRGEKRMCAGMRIAAMPV